MTGTKDTSRDGVSNDLSNTSRDNDGTSEHSTITPITARSHASRHPNMTDSSSSQIGINRFSIESFRNVRMMLRTSSERLNNNQDTSTRFVISF